MAYVCGGMIPSDLPWYDLTISGVYMSKEWYGFKASKMLAVYLATSLSRTTCGK